MAAEDADLQHSSGPFGEERIFPGRVALWRAPAKYHLMFDIGRTAKNLSRCLVSLQSQSSQIPVRQQEDHPMPIAGLALSSIAPVSLPSARRTVVHAPLTENERDATAAVSRRAPLHFRSANVSACRPGSNCVVPAEPSAAPE